MKSWRVFPTSEIARLELSLKLAGSGLELTFFSQLKPSRYLKGPTQMGAVECSEFEGGKLTPVQIWRNIGSNWREEFVL